MKKIIIGLLSLVLIFNLIGCMNKTDNKKMDKKKNKNQTEQIKDKDKDHNNLEKKYKKMSDMLKDIIKGVNVPSSETFDLDKDNFEDYSFIAWQDSLKAAVSEGQISTSAHSIVLLKSKKNEAQKISKEISKKADLRKWVCVEAEVGKVLYTNEYVILIMTNKESFEGLKNNFKKIMGNQKINTINIK
ncbi:hypothetical protein GUI37_00170 [Helcococcus kunzii]|uniref:hypothetical protein n=1 Tax=Helcococcus kunzii TaxID=40091 RepID=UPI001BB0C06F|nr:hypothetical protein [Helcococcus kunzii]QUY64008.1 hypothetical protein GUI37_00170 [Helcococcus kunzii]